MRISDWSSDVCSSDLPRPAAAGARDRKIVRSGDETRRARLFAVQGDSGPSPRAGQLLRAPLQRRTRSRERGRGDDGVRSEEHTSELQSLMRISYAVFCLKKKTQNKPTPTTVQK